MQRPNYVLISLVLVLAVVIGIVAVVSWAGCGDIMPRSCNASTAVPISSVSNITSTTQPVVTQSTNLTLKEDSAVIDAVQKVKAGGRHCHQSDDARSAEPLAGRSRKPRPAPASLSILRAIS